MTTLKVIPEEKPDINKVQTCNLLDKSAMSRNIFTKEESSLLAKRHCRKNKRTPHNALYDTICAFLLYKRLANVVNIKQFIR